MFKKVLITIFSTLLFTCLTLGQGQETFVTPGDGNLSAAIAAAGANDVLLLVPGGVYTEPGETFGVIDKPITIKLDVDTYDQKAVLRFTEDTEGNRFFALQNGASIILSGLEFDGNVNGAPAVDYLTQFDVGDDLVETFIDRIEINHCYIHDLLSNILDGGNSDMKGLVLTDSTFMDDVFSFNTGTTVYYKYSAANYIKLTNSTFAKINSYGFRIAGIGENSRTETARGIIDHTTWYDNLEREMIQVEKGPHNQPWTVTNSIFAKMGDLTRTVINIKDTPGDSLATVTNICMWDVGPRNFRNHTVMDTLYMDPQFEDPENGDYTLPAGSQLLIYGSDGGPIGDPRWATNEPPSGVEKVDNLPEKFSLSQNYPNPFNPATTINFSITESGQTSLFVYNTLGIKVATLVNENLSAGNYNVTFDAADLPSGVYVYKLQNGGHEFARKMVILK